MLVTSIFFFSHNVFKRLFPPVCQKSSLCGKGLNLSRMTNLKELENNNFEFDNNDGKFSGRIEKAVGKGEIARQEEFLLSPQSFQKTDVQQTRKNISGLLGKGISLR